MLDPDEGRYSVAIIGMHGRFPGANSIEQFWQNLCQGEESIHFFTDQELLAEHIDPHLLKRPDYVKAAGLLEGADLFDAAFFDYSPREARETNPQHRLFLECSWSALEDAGYNPFAYPGRIGLYAGATDNNYQQYQSSAAQSEARVSDEQQAMIGSNNNFLGTRVSFKLNLRGPSMNIQTGCSSSLVAVHIACQAILNSECDMALAGGVSVSLPLKAGYLYQPGAILSPDGHCRSFSADAQGTVAGSGIGVVVLKRLSDALQDGDTIYAAIKGSAINNDGSRKVSYTAPGVQGLTDVITEAIDMADVPAESITYVETVGTGTPLGDSIEVTALTQAFRARTQKQQFCAIGSVKTNIGHLDAAAGIAGLIKTVLSLYHRQLPASLNFKQPNPDIDFIDSPFYVNTTLAQWQPIHHIPIRAGVSSFGIGGTNAHIVLEEPPLSDPSPQTRSHQLLPFSARSARALQQLIANTGSYLQAHPDLSLAAIASTLQQGRQAFRYRQSIVCATTQDAAIQLGQLTSEPTLADSKIPPIFWLFSGQASQRAGTGWDLYQQEPGFSAVIDQCAEILHPLLGQDLRIHLFPEWQPDAASTLRANQQADTTLGQITSFVLEYALAHYWLNLGVRPQVLFGQGSGEYVAACLAEVFTLEDALTVLVTRATSQLHPQAPKLTCLSGSTGAWLSDATATDPTYWGKTLSSPTSLNQGLELLLTTAPAILLEIGPGQPLATLIRQDPRQQPQHLILSTLPHDQSEQAELAQIFHALGKLWQAGIVIDWQTLTDEQHTRRIPLPTYPFERQRYWLDQRPVQNDTEAAPIILLAGDTDFARAFVQHLTQHIPAQNNLIRIEAGDQFRSIAPGQYQLDASNPEHYQRLMQHIKTGGKPEIREEQPDMEAYSQDPTQDPTQAPQDELEQEIGQLWQTLFGIKTIGRNTNFYELGGDSLLALTLSTRILEQFQIQVSVQDILKNPTIAGTSAILRQKLAALLDTLELDTLTDLLEGIE